ncbi:hypothetical protein NECHADRAFT_45190 [Paecilomyces variotii No. 5]|uniref:NADH:flavin oxidoreductase/NADH oxidase N-terminal domain-containing protein n=1 Tax=Byssochlamys spectabilis (strain No. 5 / NBRC 109023) TaxID=1356009 RepID=V5F9A4_BYSSN|nr:hypothetical protein NECHADRAFT_45190 [Paecilomyces variotii No. 5]
MSKLFSPLKVGRMALKQRIAMAPMTRLRADSKNVPLDTVPEYYQQRACVPGSLLVTEATVISPQFGGYPNVPGIYSDAQIDAWRRVTDAVHSKGSYIYLQLWALGRAANPQYINSLGYDVISSSDVPMKSAFSDEMHHPRALTEDEIQRAIADFAQASNNAIKAGFDGVEIHGANGYLVDQFLQDVSNKRTDAWGGSIENRSRFALELTSAVSDTVGSDRTAIRLSPWSKYQDMRMADPIPQFSHLAEKLAQLNLAYVHVVEPEATDKGENTEFLLDAYRKASPVMVCGNYNGESAREAVDTKYKDHGVVVAFGRPYIGNPDLVFRIKNGLPLQASDFATFYGQTPEGYIDYGFSEEFKAAGGSL